MIKIGYEITYRAARGQAKKGTVTKFKLDPKGDIAGVYIGTSGRATFVKLDDVIGYDREPHRWRINPKKKRVVKKNTVKKKRVVKKNTAPARKKRVVKKARSPAYLIVAVPAGERKRVDGYWTGHVFDTAKTRARRYLVRSDAVKTAQALSAKYAGIAYRIGVLSL